MAKQVSVHGYADNNEGSGDAPTPLIQILAHQDGEVRSFSFDPKYATLIAVAILEAADTIGRGNRDKFHSLIVTAEPRTL